MNVREFRLHLTPKLSLRTHVIIDPPIDGGLLRNWLVKKDGFLYFADYFEGGF